MGVPQKTIILTCGVDERYCPGVGENPDRDYYYLLRYQPRDEEEPGPGDDRARTSNLDGTRQDFDPTNGEPIVLMDFTDSGADKFHEVTRDIVESSRFRSSQGRGEVLDSFAIVLDGRIKSAPTVDPDDNPDGIPGDNGAQITGIGDVGEAKDLALVLQTGALPIEFIQVDRTQVSATLGKDSLNEALPRVGRGPAHRRALPARRLPLPRPRRGLRPRDLLGAAVRGDPALRRHADAAGLRGHDPRDRRRGRREHRHLRTHQGRSGRRASRSAPRSRTATARASRTIVDANVVTAITALILFAVATGGVRGFAFMLLLGTGALDRHGGLRHARAARAARRLQVVRQPEVHGRERAEDGALADVRRRRQAADLVHDRGRPDRALDRLADLQGPEPRDRLPRRHADDVRDRAAGRHRRRARRGAPSSGSATRSSRAAATRSTAASASSRSSPSR